MKLYDTLILALLQGVTEFLPISSSGHLVLIQHLLGLKDVPILYALILHLGTTVAVILVYRKIIGEIVRDFVRWTIKGVIEKKELYKGGNVKLLLYILVSVSVTGITGTLFKDTLSSFFYRPRYALLFLAITGCVLLMTLFISGGEKDIKRVSITFPLVIGATQAFALLPGVSRSGTTIAAGLFLGAHRAFAASFSFLLAIPSVFGASLFEIITNHEHSGMGSEYGILFIAFMVSLLTGYLSLKLLIRFVVRGKIYFFSIYCFAFSIAGLFLIR